MTGHLERREAHQALLPRAGQGPGEPWRRVIGCRHIAGLPVPDQAVKGGHGVRERGGRVILVGVVQVDVPGAGASQGRLGG